MVQLIQWTESFAVGHQGLDAEHRRIVQIINDVCTAVHTSDGRLHELLKSLRPVTIEHLRNENAILWELRQGTYPALQGRSPSSTLVKAMAAAAFDEHVAEHGNLVGQFDKIRALPPAMLCETLQAWFVDHAIKYDAHLKAIFQAM